MFVPLNAEAIRFVERTRGEDDVQLVLTLRYQHQEAIRVRQQQGGQEKEMLYGGRVKWETTGSSFRVSRSDWVKCLRGLGWTEVELFEILKPELFDDKNLETALTLVREAETALRQHDTKGVLDKCAKAFESAAKYESSGDTKKGFDLLLNRAFPESNDKQSKLNDLIKSLRDYTQLGRHEQYPALHIGRSEAEMVLAVTLSLFSAITRRLTGHETA